MQENTEKLVTLGLLDYYDTGLKQWVVDTINRRSNMVFDSRSNFPTIGKANTLYIDQTNIYIYSEEDKTYQLINSGSGTVIKETLEWGKF